MDSQVFKEKIEGLLIGDRPGETLLDYLRDETQKLFESGGVDTDSYPDNFELPRAILQVALERAVRQYGWDGVEKYQKDIDNLRHFR